MVSSLSASPHFRHRIQNHRQTDLPQRHRGQKTIVLLLLNDVTSHNAMVHAAMKAALVLKRRAVLSAVRRWMVVAMLIIRAVTSLNVMDNAVP